MIFGLETSDELPERWTPLDAVAIIKCLDEDGDLSFCVRSTKTLTDMEAYGMFAIAAKTQAQNIVEGFEDG